MDRAEAIAILEREQGRAIERYWDWERVGEAYDLAIEALKGDLHCPKCGTIVRDGRQYHDLVYRGEAEKLQLSGETSTNSNKNSKDNLSFSKSVKLINPCNSLLKPDSDDCKEQKSKLDCISRQQAVEAICRECTQEGYDECRADCTEVAILRNLPSVTPTFETFCGVPIKEAIEVLEKYKHSPSVKVQQADTLIIATALLAFEQDSERNISDRERAGELREQVLAYGASMCQPVTPTERTGEWVSHELWDMPWFTCSECNYHGRSDFKFCPNCGADMRGDTE